MAYELLLDNIKQYFNLRSDSDIEKAANIKGGYCWKIKNDKISYPAAILNWLKSQNLNPDYFLSGEGNPELAAPLPSIPDVSARLVPYLEQLVGTALPEVTPECKLIEIPGSDVLPQLKALRVSGDSMSPTAREGDVVVCTTDGYNGDGLYVYRSQGFACLKRISLQGNSWRVISDNPVYPAWDAPIDSLEIIGRIVYILLKV